jgi:hypothetical protein
MNFIKQTLIEVKELLLRKGWTKCADARDRQGHSVYPEEPFAVCFCLNGALRAVRAPTEVTIFIAGRLPKEYKYDLLRWNDDRDRTKGEVIKFLDDCIEAAP